MSRWWVYISIALAVVATRIAPAGAAPLSNGANRVAHLWTPEFSFSATASPAAWAAQQPLIERPLWREADDRLRVFEAPVHAPLAFTLSQATLTADAAPANTPATAARNTAATTQQPPAGEGPNNRHVDRSTTLGEAPQDDALVFLRQSAVLLKPGTFEVEYGLSYTLQENDFLALLPDGSVLPEYANTRTVVGSVTVRYGLTERVQPYVILPAGLSWFERTDATRERTHEQAGLGDIVVGVNYLLRDGKSRCADLVLAFSVIAPTGESTFDSLSPNVAPLGTGFLGLSTSLSWIRNYDPVVLFAAVGHTHQFSRRFFGREVQPGEEFNYSFGGGFAVNDVITLSSQFQSSYQFDTMVDDRRIFDSRSEASVLRHSIVVRTCPQAFTEVFLTHGLTDQAPRTAVGILSTRRY